jgi:Asp-tRNA(Asn)/Glu-tRNA(Gln) amidotransferase A subunit family amidase
MTDLVFTSAAELARLIAQRTLSPVELVDMVLDRIERAPPKRR